MIPLLINQSNDSLDFPLQLSKCLADSDLVVIGLIGIGPIRKISVLDWLLPGVTHLCTRHAFMKYITDRRKSICHSNYGCPSDNIEQQPVRLLRYMYILFGERCFQSKNERLSKYQRTGTSCTHNTSQQSCETSCSDGL